MPPLTWCQIALYRCFMLYICLLLQTGNYRRLRKTPHTTPSGAIFNAPFTCSRRDGCNAVPSSAPAPLLLRGEWALKICLGDVVSYATYTSKSEGVSMLAYRTVLYTLAIPEQPYHIEYRYSIRIVPFADYRKNYHYWRLCFDMRRLSYRTLISVWYATLTQAHTAALSSGARHTLT